MGDESWIREETLEFSKSFGKKYGVLIQELRLLARAIFVVDSNDKIVYTEYVSEVGNHPNYERALEAAKQAE